MDKLGTSAKVAITAKVAMVALLILHIAFVSLAVLVIIQMPNKVAATLA